MKSYTVLAVIYVTVAVAQMTEECHRPELCTSVISIAPVTTHRKRTNNNNNYCNFYIFLCDHDLGLSGNVQLLASLIPKPSHVNVSYLCVTLELKLCHDHVGIQYTYITFLQPL